MEKKIAEIKNEVNQLEEHTEDVYQLAIRTLDRNYKRERFMIKCLLGIIAALIFVLLYFGYIIYTTKCITNTTTQDGVNFNVVKVDDEGNIITSDLSAQEMQDIIDQLNQQKENAD